MPQVGMSYFLFLIFVFNYAYGTECSDFLHKNTSNIVQLTEFRSNLVSSNNRIEVIAERIRIFEKKWRTIWNANPKEMSESEKIEFLLIVRDLLLNKNKDYLFESFEVNMFETIANHILYDIKHRLVTRADISGLRDILWAELLTYFEIRKFDKSNLVYSVPNLNRALKRFFESRGGDQNSKYQELVELIRLAQIDSAN